MTTRHDPSHYDGTRMAGITSPLHLATARERRRRRVEFAALTALLVLGLVLLMLAVLMLRLPEVAVR